MAVNVSKPPRKGRSALGAHSWGALRSHSPVGSLGLPDWPPALREGKSCPHAACSPRPGSLRAFVEKQAWGELWLSLQD